MKTFSIKSLSVLLAIISIWGAISIPVSAAEPRWTNTNSIILTLDPTESPIYIYAFVGGKPGATFSNGTVTLTHNGVVVGRWSKLSSSNAYFQFSNNNITRQQGTYVLSISITVTINGVSEVVSSSKTVVC